LSLFFAKDLVFIEEFERTLITIEVHAKTPPKHAPITGGRLRSKIRYEEESELDKIKDQTSRPKI
jgi:hypothetical protein